MNGNGSSSTLILIGPPIFFVYRFVKRPSQDRGIFLPLYLPPSLFLSLLLSSHSIVANAFHIGSGQWVTLNPYFHGSILEKVFPLPFRIAISEECWWYECKCLGGFRII